MEPKSNESVEVFCAETAISVSNVASMFAAKKRLFSNSFFCQRDSCPVIFKMMLSFGDDDDNEEGLCVWLNPLNRDVSVKRWNFTIVDSHGNSVVSHDEHIDEEHWMINWQGGVDVTAQLAPSQLAPAADVVWRCTTKIYYEGSSGEPTHMSGDLLKLLESAECADITFSVGGEEIKAHKAILFARSKYFAAMFRSKSKEDSSGKIDVPDADPKVFRGMLEFLYGGFSPKQLDDIALDLFIIADKYGIDKLRDICELNLRTHLNADNVVDALLLAERHNLQDLMAAAKVVFRANRDVLMQSEDNREKLTQDILAKLM